MQHLRDLIPAAANVLLEEVELVVKAPVKWSVTLSFHRSRSATADFPGIQVREYRVFTIVAATGHVQSMRIRQV